MIASNLLRVPSCLQPLCAHDRNNIMFDGIIKSPDSSALFATMLPSSCFAFHLAGVRMKPPRSLCNIHYLWKVMVLSTSCCVIASSPPPSVVLTPFHVVFLIFASYLPNPCAVFTILLNGCTKPLLLCGVHYSHAVTVRMSSFYLIALTFTPPAVLKC